MAAGGRLGKPSPCAASSDAPRGVPSSCSLSSGYYVTGHHDGQQGEGEQCAFVQKYFKIHKLGEKVRFRMGKRLPTEGRSRRRSMLVSSTGVGATCLLQDSHRSPRQPRPAGALFPPKGHSSHPHDHPDRHGDHEKKSPWLRTPDTQASCCKPRAAELFLQQAREAGGPEPRVLHACPRPALGVWQGVQHPKPATPSPSWGWTCTPVVLPAPGVRPAGLSSRCL